MEEALDLSFDKLLMMMMMIPSRAVIKTECRHMICPLSLHGVAMFNYNLLHFKNSRAEFFFFHKGFKNSKYYYYYYSFVVDSDVHAIQGVGLWPLACWDCWFEFCWGHGYLCLVSVVCCQVDVSATGRSLVQGRPT